MIYIAEIGQNHNGSLDTAKRMVDSLVNTGVTHIKTAKRDCSIYPNTPYINENSFGKTYRLHREFLEFSEKDFIELKNYVEKKGFEFLSSFTDLKSLNFLNDIGVETFKLASCVNNDKKILLRLSEIGKPVIASTGMCNWFDVINISNRLQNIDLSFLQCTSAYPCDIKDLNLKSMVSYKKLVNKVGFSNHSDSLIADFMAYILGADIIERHYTLDKTMKGTDHQISIEKSDIETFFIMKRQADKILGNEKIVLECEKESIKKLRGALI